jgi:zinc protease
MVSARLNEISQRPESPFAYGGMGRGSFTRTRDVLQLYAGVKGSDFVKAADALIAEAERVRRFGFTASELDRARANYLRGLEQRYAERDKTNSSAFAGQYVSSALNDTPILNIGDEQTLAQRFAPTVTLAELNALARSSFPKQDRVVIVAAPDKPEIKLPSRADMLAVFDRPADASLTAYVDSTSDAPLVATLPKPGKVVSRRRCPKRESSSGACRTARRCCSSPATSSATRCCSPRRARAGSPCFPIPS